MNLLALDTTAVAASAAVLREGRIVSFIHSEAGAARGELLLPMIEHCLAAASLSFGAIDAYACTNGPGSFTGVRIGVATVKGLAFGANRPCVAVSTLRAIAENLRYLPGIYCAAMDARRSELYTALFAAGEDGTVHRLCEDAALPVAELADIARKYAKDKPIYTAGDGAHIARRALTEAGLCVMPTPELLAMQTAASVARCAYRELLAGRTVTAEALAPLYLRVPQAERERNQKIQ